ncbi:hypothetical protein KIN20_002934 [Parelaphostrongylus tenuis]|uniref:Ubiquitin-related modifier 1 homolog n=1 Tax=Parelaphostrongylus tenuis TaxID=148309 RepID=A0AAD5M0I7_PARTN|nr:hypothetical protein KIN20_002934 [Parelaphostrongylus tenuis]
MGEVSLVIEFSGGCEFLVGNKKEHQVSLPCDEDFVTVADVIRYVRDVMLQESDRRDLLIQGETIRPGVLLLVNECDWDLLDCEKCQLHNGDVVTFISTLHGG